MYHLHTIPPFPARPATVVEDEDDIICSLTRSTTTTTTTSGSSKPLQSSSCSSSTSRRRRRTRTSVLLTRAKMIDSSTTTKTSSSCMQVMLMVATADSCGNGRRAVFSLCFYGKIMLLYYLFCFFFISSHDHQQLSSYHWRVFLGVNCFASPPLLPAVRTYHCSRTSTKRRDGKPTVLCYNNNNNNSIIIRRKQSVVKGTTITRRKVPSSSSFLSSQRLVLLLSLRNSNNENNDENNRMKNIVKRESSSSAMGGEGGPSTPKGPKKGAEFEYQEMRAQFNVMKSVGLVSRDLSWMKKNELNGYIQQVIEQRSSTLTPTTTSSDGSSSNSNSNPPCLSTALMGTHWRLVYSTEPTVIGDLPRDATIYIHFMDNNNNNNNKKELDYILQFGGQQQQKSSFPFFGLNNLKARSDYTVDDTNGLVTFIYRDITTDAFGLQGVNVGLFGLLKGRVVYIQTVYFDGEYWIDQSVDVNGKDFTNVYVREA